jgi:hypothetical protein
MNKPTLADQLNGSLPIISSTARAGFVASHFILALGSGFAIMYLVIGAAGEHLAPWLSYVVAWAGSLVWYRAIENPLRKFILFAWAYVLTSKAERAELTDNLKRTGRASAWVTAILLLATLSLSLLINVDVAKAVTVEQDSSVEIAQSVAVTGSYNNDVGLLRDQLNEARARDADRTDAAKTQAASWISQAEASKGTAMRNLMRKGNEWASIQLSGAISRARAKGERHVAEVKANSESPTLQGHLTAYIGARSASRDTVATMTAGLVGARRADFTNTLGRRNYMLMIAVFFVLVIFVYSARLLVLACLETGEDLDSHDGDGVFKVAGSMVGKINAKLGRTLEDKFGDKLVLASIAATPQFVAPAQRFVAPSQQPVATTPTTRPEPVANNLANVVGQGFQAVAASCSPEDIRRYKDQFRHAQTRQHTSASQTGRDNNRDKFAEAVGVLSALGYGIEETSKTYRQAHNIDGKPKVVTFKIKTWSE